mgnify:CR=1 FL=1
MSSKYVYSEFDPEKHVLAILPTEVVSRLASALERIAEKMEPKGEEAMMSAHEIKAARDEAVAAAMRSPQLTPGVVTPFSLGNGWMAAITANA